jgi:aminopeptidase 2
VPSDVFKLNAETVGVYRVAYTPERLAKLGSQAANFSPADRLRLMSDASALAQAGYTPSSGALALAAALAKGEKEYLPLSRISAFFSSLAGSWWEHPLREAIDKLRIDIFKPVVERLGYEFAASDEPEVRELRKLAISVCARAGDPDVIAALQEQFVSKGGDIVPDLRQITYRTVVAHGGEKEYNVVADVYTNPPVPMARTDAVWGLAAARDPVLVKRTLDMIPSDAVKDQDVYIFFMGLAANSAARRDGAQYLMDRWDELNKRFHASFGLRNAIGGAFGALSSKKDLEKVEAFVKDNGESKRGGELTADTAKYATILEQAVEGMRARAAWVERDTEDVASWFKQRS